VLEYWSVGILGLAELNLFYMNIKDQKIKSDHHPLFIPNIPLFQYSITPLLRDRDFYVPPASAISLFIVHNSEN